MLYLEHCIIFCNNSNFKIFLKNFFLHFNSFENIMENGTFAPQENLTFQRSRKVCPKALVWSKGLTHWQGERVHKRMHIGAVLPEPSPLACTKYTCRGRGRLRSGWKLQNGVSE